MCALGLLVSGLLACQSTDTPQTTAPKAPERAQSAVSDPEPGTLERRARAGIDKGETTPTQEGAPREESEKRTRIPAAEFVNTNPPVQTPEVDGGERQSDVESALMWFKSTWISASRAEEGDAYLALLNTDFRGHDPAQDKVITRETWLELRRPLIGSPGQYGIIQVTANPNNTGRISLEMQESFTLEGACVFTKRMVSLQPIIGGTTRTWQVSSEEISAPRPCPEASVRDVIAVHKGLGIAWRGQDLSATQKAIYGGFTLLDGGVEAAQYNHAALTTGAGRWVLDEVAKHEANASNTRLVGNNAVVTHPSGHEFAYTLAGESWRLRALWRPTTSR